MDSCTVTPFCGQDAQYGWDVEHAASTRFARDKSVTDQPVALDQVTGLEWQACPVGLSGNYCTTGTAQKLNWESAVEYCENLVWGGKDDWYLPDPYQLNSIVDYSRNGPAINFEVFYNTPAEYFWTSSSCASKQDNAWCVNFNSGGTNIFAKSFDTFTRCVRQGDSLYVASDSVRLYRHEIVAGEPIVMDNLTGLVWQGCLPGTSGSNCSSGESMKMLWKESLSYCEGLDWGGYNDWRLPNITELQSIVDTRKNGPAVDIEIFPRTPKDAFWSSSTPPQSPNVAWCVSFSTGNLSWSGKQYNGNIRCVRKAR